MKNNTIGFGKRSFLTLSLLSILTACGGGGASSEPPTATPTPTPTPVPTPTPTPTPTPVLDHSGLTPISAQTPVEGEHLSGGVITVEKANKDAFSQRPQPVIDNFTFDGSFTSGDHLFRTPHADNGPLMNNNTCQGCHLNDGKGELPKTINDPMVSMLVKIGTGTGVVDSVYGDQIQTFAHQSFETTDLNAGLPKHQGSVNGDKLYGEAFGFIQYETLEGQFADGEKYTLRKPVYKFKDLSFGPFDDGIQFSPRVAPIIFGAGLLGAIPQENIIKLVDENDENKDGISGRASMVKDALSGQSRLGRFAYKAQNPTVLQQVAGAYNGDIGITSKVFPNESCTSKQVACQNEAAKEQKIADKTDLTDLELALVEFYNRVLAVPQRRGYDVENKVWETDIVAGRQLFFDSGCAGCHTPRHVTGEASGSVLGEIGLAGLSADAKPLAFLSSQTIYPYTDLLLHDMGGSCQVTQENAQGQSCTASAKECMTVQRCEGLADGVAQGMASGTEWKTPPLWGAGLVQTVNPDATFLHDGRARTLSEAVLWHGGEAQSAQQKFVAMNNVERQQLMAFLGSL